VEIFAVFRELNTDIKILRPKIGDGQTYGGLGVLRPFIIKAK
jgi:hypothetical protein